MNNEHWNLSTTIKRKRQTHQRLFILSLKVKIKTFLDNTWINLCTLTNSPRNLRGAQDFGENVLRLKSSQNKHLYKYIPIYMYINQLSFLKNFIFIINLSGTCRLIKITYKRWKFYLYFKKLSNNSIELKVSYIKRLNN